MTTHDLPLHGIQIERYRGIRHLQLPRLEKVNLFVGVNNVGKTSLLEAIHLYATRTPIMVLASIIREHSGYRPAFSSRGRDQELAPDRVGAAVEAVRSLFHGSFSDSVVQPIRIGSLGNGAEPMTISMPWSPSSGPGDSSATELLLSPESPLIAVERGEKSSALTLDWFVRRFGLILGRTAPATMFVPAEGLDARQFANLWDRAAAAGQAEAVEEALRSIVPELERVYLVGESAVGGRSITVQMRGTERPVPIASMGDGTRRMFGIALSMVQSSGGVALIDEIENGLHYTVQQDVWRAILRLANRLNVQVFATTHSWDAIQAFAGAAACSPEVEGRMHRLENKDGELRLVDFDEEDLSIVTRQRIEVR